MFTGWFTSSENSSKKKKDISVTKPRTELERWLAMYEEQPEEIRIASALVAGSIVGSVATLALVKLYNRFLRRYPTHEWITPDLYLKKRWIKGMVTRVGDADGLRLYHTPIPSLFWRLRGIPGNRRELTGQTISIRLAGIDAPELGHFNKEAQAFSTEALKWLKQMVLGKIVYCQLLKRDQYARTVAAVVLPRRFLPGFLAPRFGKPLADEMLRAGLAVVYKGDDAVYGRGGKEGHLVIEAGAKEKKRGQWVNGVNIETPSEYKRRHRSASALEEDASESETAQQAEEAEMRSKGGLRRVWSKWFGSN